jgi:hypothetical protein
MRDQYMRRLLHAGGTLVVLAGGLTAGSVAMLASPAGAATCTSADGSTCSITGTLTLTPGVITLTTPDTLSWTALLNGTTQSVVDTNLADQSYDVTDGTGSATGWHITTAATTFTNGTATLPDTGTFSTNGSITSVTSGAAPGINCAGATACTPAVNGLAGDYPIAIPTDPTAPTPTTVFSANVGTGLGDNVIGLTDTSPGGTNPVGWWVTVPANAVSGATGSTYTSTITMAVISGP